MSIKKTLTVVAAAGALAAVSVPAMAFENEFHGTYTFNAIFSNFQYGGGAQYNPATYNENKQMNNYFEQRGRIQYIAKASDDLKLVTHFELDTRFGGITDNKYTNTSDAGVADADGITIETKHIYLDANLGKNFNLKTGIMPYKDTLKGVFVDADLPAIYTTTKLGSYTLGVGLTRFDEAQQSATAATRLGDSTKDLFILDNTFALGKDTKAAFSYYFYNDNKTASANPIHIHTFGLSGESKMGPATVSGFLAAQAGSKAESATVKVVNYHGWAANAAAKLAAGPGTAKAAFLYLSGNSSNDIATTGGGSNRAWFNAGVNSYNESGMMILARNTANSPTNTDTYLRRMVSDIALLSCGYDANLSKELYLNANVGFGWAGTANTAATDKATNKQNSSTYMGTEINLESGYKVSDNLTLRAQAAYAMLGGYYKGSAANGTAAAAKDPENPYTMRLLASFKF